MSKRTIFTESYTTVAHTEWRGGRGRIVSLPVTGTDTGALCSTVSPVLGMLGQVDQSCPLTSLASQPGYHDSVRHNTNTTDISLLLLTLTGPRLWPPYLLLLKEYQHSLTLAWLANILLRIYTFIVMDSLKLARSLSSDAITTFYYVVPIVWNF